MIVLSRTSIADPHGNLFAPQTFGSVNVKYDGREFFVINSKGVQSLIQRTDLSQELRGISSDNLQKMKDLGYFTLNKRGEDYSLRFDGRLAGGGPICGLIGYWGTKAVCYGGAIAAATAAVVSTGGAIAGPVGAAIASGAASTIATTTGTGIVAGAIASSPVAVGVATEISIAAVSSAGGIGGAIAAVESASSLIGSTLLLCPFLP